MRDRMAKTERNKHGMLLLLPSWYRELRNPRLLGPNQQSLFIDFSPHPSSSPATRISGSFYFPLHGNVSYLVCHGFIFPWNAPAASNHRLSFFLSSVAEGNLRHVSGVTQSLSRRRRKGGGAIISVAKQLTLATVIDAANAAITIVQLAAIIFHFERKTKSIHVNIPVCRHASIDPSNDPASQPAWAGQSSEWYSIKKSTLIRHMARRTYQLIEVVTFCCLFLRISCRRHFASNRWTKVLFHGVYEKNICIFVIGKYNRY